VNFWRPSGTTTFRAIEIGAPFLFKLHSPVNYIVGGGFFVTYSALPLSLAWEAFGEKNGAANYSTFYAQISKYRERKGHTEHDPLIGCIVLSTPFFLSEENWIPVSEDWSPNLVQGKTYDTQEPRGAVLWKRVQNSLQEGKEQPLQPDVQTFMVNEEPARYSAEYLTRARLGQGTFRVLVTDAYNRRCALTGERTLPVLQASHIKPFSQSGPNRTSNGLLLRADLHILFDQEYLTVTKDLKAEVSQKIKEEYENGQDYYALHGRALSVIPSRKIDRPSIEFLQWHNQNVFVL
jgi:putative restriction endonuclease